MKAPTISIYNHEKFTLKDSGRTEEFITGRANPVPKATPEGFKYCTSCEEVKETKEFHKDKKEKDGFHSNCKECRK